MRSDDHRADNLLLRLFSYTPRTGRLPLEDFCTEALAWCLRNCGSFRVGFLECLNLKAKDGGHVAIGTQNSYGFKEDEDRDEEEVPDAGRFDLVMQLGDDDLLAIIETKVGAAFSADQLRRYREELKRQKRLLGFKDGILITLTDKAEEPKGADVHRTWSIVQRLLEHQVATIGSSDHAAKVCSQFAEFLKEKGLGAMNVPKTIGEPLNEWVNGMKFLKRLEEVLKSVKNDSDLVRVLGRRRIVSEETKDGIIWIGIYGNEQGLWLGFAFRQKSDRTQVVMVVQKSVAGDRRRDFPELEPEYADGKTWLTKERDLDRGLDGNGEKIKECLLDSAKWLLKIK